MSSKIPTKLSSKRFKLPWFNRELKRLCRKKSRKYKKAKRSGKEHHWKEYKEFPILKNKLKIVTFIINWTNT